MQDCNCRTATQGILLRNPAIRSQYYVIDPMTPDPPKYRPLERFWPYAELPEQPTDDELAALDPDLYEALFGAQQRPFSITLVFSDLDVPQFPAALEHRARVGGIPRNRRPAPLCRYRARFWSSDAATLRDLFQIVGALRRHRSPDRRSAGAVRARAVAAARLVPHSAVRSVAPPSIDRDLQRLEAELKQLEAEYNMFFAGRLPKPPWETRARVEALVKQFDRAHIPNTGDRFRFTTLQSRYADVHRPVGSRAARARRGASGTVRRRSTLTAARGDEGTGGSHPPRRVVSRSGSRDRQAHRSLRIARRSAARSRRGRAAVPQVRRAGEDPGQEAARRPAAPEVAFRVAVKDGKVNFTARALKGVTE